MIDELRIYTLATGGLPEYMRLAEDVAVPIRGDDYGKLIGFWFGEIGAANRIFNMWRHESLDRRQAIRVELEKNTRWQTEYVPKIRPLMRDQIIRFMTPLMPLATPAGTGNLYEIRLLRATIGKSRVLAEKLAAAQAGAGMTTVGVWTTFAGQIHEVVHIVAWRDLAARMASTLRQGAWCDLMNDVAGLIEDVDSSLAIPGSHSPLR